MTLMHASVNVGCQGKSGPGKIHEVILVANYSTEFDFSTINWAADGEERR